jgi:hypothetical protein
MIVNINSWPGVGKLSIAEQLQQRIGGRLLDNHTIFNVAFSLCEFRTPEFFETVRAVREVAFKRASMLPSNIPLIMTSAYADTPFGRENWAAIRDLADARAVPLCNIVLDCLLEENIRRLRSAERIRLRKLTDPASLVSAREKRELLAKDGDFLLRLDVSRLTPEQSASRIVEDFALRGGGLVGRGRHGRRQCHAIRITCRILRARHRQSARCDRTTDRSIAARRTDALGRTTRIQKVIDEIGARILLLRILLSRILLLRARRLRDLILLRAHRRAGRSRIHIRKCEIDPSGRRAFDRGRRGHRTFHQRSCRRGKDRKPGHSAHGERSQGLPIGGLRTTAGAAGPIGINVRKRAHRINPPTNRTANLRRTLTQPHGAGGVPVC